ncbi:MAG: nucleotide exchange factor GrpE [Ruminiclostridium sp.]|nr:nucleotide exchange factor GrpE [Ruminiclostridium sp.]
MEVINKARECGERIITDYRLDGFYGNFSGLKLCYITSRLDAYFVRKIQIFEDGDLGEPKREFTLQSIENLDLFIEKFKDLQIDYCYIVGEYQGIRFAVTILFSVRLIRVTYDKNFELNTDSIMKDLEKTLLLQQETEGSHAVTTGDTEDIQPEGDSEVLVIKEAVVKSNESDTIYGKIIENQKQESEELNINSEIFIEIERKLDALQSSFDESIKYDKYKDELFDNLHKELTKYKNSYFDKAVDTMAMDIIRLIDTTKKTADLYQSKEYSEDNYKRILSLFEGMVEDLQDVLYRQNIESYSVPGNEVDVRQQKIISTQETTDESLHNKVATRLAVGYEKNGSVLRPERVSIYKFTKNGGSN